MRIQRIGHRDMYLNYLAKLKSLHPDFNLYSAGIDFRRQNRPSNVDPLAVRIQIFLMVVDA